MQLVENIQLRKLLGARAAVPVPTMMSEILYDARDSSARKIVLDRGLREGVKLGLPVIDNAGVVGQVTRVFPFTSEVTLLTDKEQAIPVQVLRNGLRSVAYGRGQSGLLDLRFVAPNADIVVQAGPGNFPGTTGALRLEASDIDEETQRWSRLVERLREIAEMGMDEEEKTQEAEEKPAPAAKKAPRKKTPPAVS